jgi:hypothetical protein
MLNNCFVGGAMTGAATTLALFTFIREAQRRKKPVAVDLFGDRHFEVPFSNSHREVAQRVLQNYHIPGGGNSVAGPELLVDRLQAGDLLMYVTDVRLEAVEVIDSTPLLAA